MNKKIPTTNTARVYVLDEVLHVLHYVNSKTDDVSSQFTS